jgi:hypothetical protein
MAVAVDSSGNVYVPDYYHDRIQKVAPCTATIFWRNNRSGANRVWYMNRVAMRWVVALPALTNLEWKLVGTADFNDDGKPDIVWRNTATGENQVWYMDGITKTGIAALPAQN